MLKRFLKNERGLTLIELLAVVVILGIIAAIAVPSIGGIIDNTKKDAHIANAQQMISAVKVAIAGNSKLAPVAASDTTYINIKYLMDNGYLQSDLQDPDGGVYKGTAGTAIPNTTNSAITDTSTDDSFVKISKGTTGAIEYRVVLNGQKRKIPLTLESALKRELVVPNTAASGD